MSSQPERTPEEEESDPELEALLKEVARPATVAANVADHLRIPATIALDGRALGTLVERPEERAPSPGELLDQHYRVERELGRGGMGIVYEALNLRTGKRVALKWMWVASDHAPERVQAMSRRFRREARAAASVRHPNVVDIYDVAGSDSAPFLVMELLEGEPLRAFMTRTRASWEQALGLVLPVLRGVGAMHRAGVIHRDLKPDNIFLCRQGEASDALPKVLDFGVAAMQDSADGLGSLTRSGALLGTPSYMPLEQLTGKALDARADLYALGVVLYELLTGKLPFAASTAGELAVMQATQRPTPPSVHNSALRGAREALLLKALARDPADRFESAEAFAEALRSAGARTSWRARRARAMAVLLGVIMSAGAWQWWQANARSSTRGEPAASRALRTGAPEAPVELPRSEAPAIPVTPSPPPLEVPSAAQHPSPTAPAAPARRPEPVRRNEAPKNAGSERRPTDLRIDDF